MLELSAKSNGPPSCCVDVHSFLPAWPVLSRQHLRVCAAAWVVFVHAYIHTQTSGKEDVSFTREAVMILFVTAASESVTDRQQRQGALSPSTHTHTRAHTESTKAPCTSGTVTLYFDHEVIFELGITCDHVFYVRSPNPNPSRFLFA